MNYRKVRKKHGKAIDRNRSDLRRYLRGMTLVEVMVAGFIMALVLSSCAVSFQFGLNMVYSARTTTFASQILQDEAEVLRLASWSKIDDYKSESDVTIPAHLSESADYIRNLTVKRFISDSATYSGMKEIELVASWQDMRGISRTKRLHFVYSDNGIYDYIYSI